MKKGHFAELENRLDIPQNHHPEHQFHSCLFDPNSADRPEQVDRRDTIVFEKSAFQDQHPTIRLRKSVIYELYC